MGLIIPYKPPVSLIIAGFFKILQTCQWACGSTDKRCQSTPATSHCHCASLIEKQGSLTFGQTKQPRCRRRWQSQTPFPSQTKSRNLLPGRFLNTNTDPAHGECPKDCWTIIDSPSMPRRMSTGATASQIRSGAGISPDTLAARPAMKLTLMPVIPAGGLWRGARRFDPSPSLQPVSVLTPTEWAYGRHGIQINGLKMFCGSSLPVGNSLLVTGRCFAKVLRAVSSVSLMPFLSSIKN